MEDDLKETLCRLGEKLLRPEVRKSAEALSALLADGFIEFGGSERVFDKFSLVPYARPCRRPEPLILDKPVDFE